MKNFEEFNKLNELAHPKRIVLHDPKEEYLSRFNRLYRQYQRLQQYMKDSDMPQEDIDKAKQKADDMFDHLKLLHHKHNN